MELKRKGPSIRAAQLIVVQNFFQRKKKEYFLCSSQLIPIMQFSILVQWFFIDIDVQFSVEKKIE